MIQSFWDYDIGIAITFQHKLRPTGDLSNIGNNVINGRCVVWGKVASENIRLPTPHHHLEAENVGTKLLERLK